MFDKYGAVNLEELREKVPRLRIANEVAEQQKFFHWELEFSDVFENRGGFDLVVGNPPWIKLEWNEEAVLGDRQPLFAVKKFTATQTAKVREELLCNTASHILYFTEYESMTGQQAFMNAVCNYPLLKGQQTNLFKCFLPQAWEFGNSNGVSSFIHPDGIFDDPKGGIFREKLYPHLRYHFKFQNEHNLFDIMHTRSYSLNIYGAPQKQISFDCIFDLYEPETIDFCYAGNSTKQVPGYKDKNGDWNTEGHQDRIINVSRKQLS